MPVVCPNGGTFHLDARRVCAWCPSICKLRIHELCQHYVRAYGLILDKVYSGILGRGVVQILVFQACLVSLYLYFLAFVFLHMTEFPVEVMRFLDGHGEKFLMAVSKTPGIKKTVSEFRCGKRKTISKYEMRSNDGTTFRFWLVIKKRLKEKKGKRRWEYLTYATNVKHRYIKRIMKDVPE